MYSGSMIDELIATVVRAEAHARQATPVREIQPTMIISEPAYPRFAYQAPFYAATMGAA